MAVNPQFIAVPISTWAQICQLMPTRKAMLICALGADVVLSLTPNSPLVVTVTGSYPAGIYLSAGVAGDVGEPTIFDLSETINGELVSQAWYAWQVQVVHAVQFLAGGATTWTVPPGVFNVFDIYVWGSGGSTPGPGVIDGDPGGGGGSFARTGPLATAPGTTWNISVDITGNELQSTVTDPAAVLVASAGSGKNAVGTVGGAGGVATVGVELRSGGAGFTTTGTGPDGGGGGGSGGLGSPGQNAPGGTLPGLPGGVPGLDGEGIGGGGGNGSTAPFGNATQGDLPGGGAGGQDTTVGGANSGQDGQVSIFYAVTTNPCIVSVFEAFDVVIPPRPPIKFNVALPKLSPDAIKALNGLLAEMEQYNEAENAGIHQHGNSRHGGGGASQAESAP